MDHEAAVFIVVVVQFTRGMLLCGMLALRATFNAPIGAHQLFNLRRGGVTGEIEQFLFVLRVGDPGHGAHLGKAELTRGKRCGDQR